MSGKIIVLDSYGRADSSNFNINLSPSIDLEGLQYQATLRRLDMSWSYNNISAANGNNTFKYFNGVIDQTITIPDGTFNHKDLISEIHDQMAALGDVTIISGVNVYSLDIVMDENTGYSSLILSNSYEVDFTVANSLRSIFGFNSAVYVISTLAPNKANINAGVNQVLVHLNICAGSSWVNNSSSDVIYSFGVDYDPNDEIHFEPPDSFIAVNSRNKLTNLNLYFTNERNIPLHFNNVPITATIYLQPIMQPL